MKRNLPLFPDTPSQDLSNLSFILDLSPSFMTLGLSNIKRLLSALDHPQRAFDSVVVAGTNGKGSVTTLLSSILTANGRRVGRLISPHIYSVAERISINEEPVSLELLERAASRIVPLHGEIGFSYFEGITAIAFLLFAEAGVDTAVLEVGLGGRFDATNSVEPVLSIITSITIDHRRLLGDTEEEIIREKLGITRRGVPLLCGRLNDRLAEIVCNRSKRDRFPVQRIDDIGVCRMKELAADSMRVSLKTKRCDYGDIAIKFLGAHQVDNVLLAAGAAEHLLGTVPKLAHGLERAFLPGRFEHRLVRGRNVILDVAHNDAALTGVLDTLLELSPPENNTLVLGMMRRKELFEFPARAVASSSRIYLVEAPDGDACSPQELLARFGYDTIQSAGIDLVLVNGVRRGDAGTRFCERVLAATPPSGMILVTGSHRTVEQFGAIFAKGDIA